MTGRLELKIRTTKKEIFANTMSAPIEINTRTTVDIPVNVTIYDVLTEAKRQWTNREIIEDILKFCCAQDDTEFTFETELIAALQKFKEDNQ